MQTLVCVFLHINYRMHCLHTVATTAVNIGSHWILVLISQALSQALIVSNTEIPVFGNRAGNGGPNHNVHKQSMQQNLYTTITCCSSSSLCCPSLHHSGQKLQTAVNIFCSRKWPEAVLKLTSWTVPEQVFVTSHTKILTLTRDACAWLAVGGVGIVSWTPSLAQTAVWMPWGGVGSQSVVN